MKKNLSMVLFVTLLNGIQTDTSAAALPIQQCWLPLAGIFTAVGTASVALGAGVGTAIARVFPGSAKNVPVSISEKTMAYASKALHYVVSAVKNNPVKSTALAAVTAGLAYSAYSNKDNYKNEQDVINALLECEDIATRQALTLTNRLQPLDLAKLDIKEVFTATSHPKLSVFQRKLINKHCAFLTAEKILDTHVSVAHLMIGSTRKRLLVQALDEEVLIRLGFEFFTVKKTSKGGKTETEILSNKTFYRVFPWLNQRSALDGTKNFPAKDKAELAEQLWKLKTQYSL